MFDAIFSWLFVALLAEIAVLMFLLYRRYWRARLPRLLFAMFGLFAAFMALMAGAVTLSEGPRAWALEDGVIVAAVAAALLLWIVWLASTKSEPDYQRTRFGDAARVRDEADPRRKRGCFADLLGCLGIGVVLLIGLFLLVAFGTGFASP